MFGFKKSLDFFNGNRRKSKKDKVDIGSMVSITGAYRSNRDEFFGYYSDPNRRSTPNAPNNMPSTSTKPAPTKTPLRPAKSTSDLILNKNLPPNLRPENPGISKDPRGAESINNIPQEPPKRPERKLDAQIRVDKQRLEEQKKLERQRLEEQKKLEKQRQAEQKKKEREIAQQEKLRKEREKKELQQAKKKKQAPQRPMANPLAQASTSRTNPLASGSGQVPYTTNTLESSISKSSGPPPYSAAKPEGEKDSSGNVTYTKPEDSGSWDMISKHRQNINRPATSGSMPQTKQTVMDLNYKVDEENRRNSEDNTENSEA